jgi:hypothetical protein
MMTGFLGVFAALREEKKQKHVSWRLCPPALLPFRRRQSENESTGLRCRNSVARMVKAATRRCH